MTWSWFDIFQQAEISKLRKENNALREACLWAISTLTDRDEEDLNDTDRDVIDLLKKVCSAPAVNHNQTEVEA